jgi:hypothetical protein
MVLNNLGDLFSRVITEGGARGVTIGAATVPAVKRYRHCLAGGRVPHVCRRIGMMLGLPGMDQFMDQRRIGKAGSKIEASAARDRRHWNPRGRGMWRYGTRCHGYYRGNIGPRRPASTEAIGDSDAVEIEA